MNRKEFIKKSCLLGIGSGALFLIGGIKKGGGDPLAQRSDKERKFFESWLKNLLSSMDRNLDEKTRIMLMENCGRACAKKGAVNSAKACKGNLDKFLSTLQRWIGKENVKQNGKDIHLTYTKCYCELVHKGPEKLSDTYCHCSKGWVLEMFETVMEKPVKVKLLDSIKRGGKVCRLTVQI